jgi:hypothetical protein
MQSDMGEAILERRKDAMAVYQAKRSEFEALSNEVHRLVQIAGRVDPRLLEREERVRLELAAARRSAYAS